MSEKFQAWAILEIMGHQTFSGFVTAEEIAGQSFIRIDVPAYGDVEPFTKYFGPSSVYGITPVTKEVAILRAQALGKLPMTAWDLPEELRAKLRAAPALPEPMDDEEERDDDGYDGEPF